MAVTPVGNPYVESSDLVANYPGASEALAERIDIVGVNPFANAAARDAAIPSPVQGQMCSLNDDNKGYRYDGSAWILFSGAGNANFTNAATGTYTDVYDYKYITFTGSGSLVIDQAGFADVLIIGGGGAGSPGRTGNVGGGGGGAGGHSFITNAYLKEGSLTVVVGAGAVGDFDVQYNGLSSQLDVYIGVGGGAGSVYGRAGESGGSGGGGGGRNFAGTSLGGSPVTNQGNSGGSTTNLSGIPGAGGGGAGAVGANGGGTGGNGGAGLSNSITNTAVTRAGGGGGARNGGTAGVGGAGGGGAGSNSGVGTAGTVNLGGGGGGSLGSVNGSSGGSGLVIVRVRTN